MIFSNVLDPKASVWISRPDVLLYFSRKFLKFQLRYSRVRAFPSPTKLAIFCQICKVDTKYRYRRKRAQFFQQFWQHFAKSWRGTCPQPVAPNILRRGVPGRTSASRRATTRRCSPSVLATTRRIKETAFFGGGLSAVLSQFRWSSELIQLLSEAFLPLRSYHHLNTFFLNISLEFCNHFWTERLSLFRSATFLQMEWDDWRSKLDRGDSVGNYNKIGAR